MRLRLLSALSAILLAPGCVMVQVGVTNPIPGLTTVAVAPFLNLSAERAVDGRRFALAYASELQKVPGFEVIPVGVTEVAMVDGKIDLNDPDEVLKLAKILRVDAVVVGAVTEYSPYYPPRTGMQVNWYSPRAWSFYPGIQIEPATRCQLNDWDRQRRQDWRDSRRQKDEECAPETPVWQRAYRCFQRWPGIRTLYGEPTLAGSERDNLTWRAQSPAAGAQTSSQASSPDIDRGGESIPSNVPPQSARGAVENKPDGPGASFVKRAHYQEMPGLPGHIRQVVTREGGESQNPLSVPPPLPGVAPPNGPGDEPAVDVNAPQYPRVRPETAPPPTNGGEMVPAPKELPTPEDVGKAQIAPPPEASPFDGPFPGDQARPNEPPMPGPEQDFPPPRPSEPGPERPPNLGSAMPPIRDPALAPCPPQPNPFNVSQPIQPWQSDPHAPLMSYTRLFDGADGDLVAALRDYVELNGDLRSGGWEAYLHRSDDFIRFTSYRMILEMLSLHGGEGKHRMIFKFRKYR